MSAVIEYFEHEDLTAANPSSTSRNAKALPLRFRSPTNRAKTDSGLIVRANAPVEIPEGTSDIFPTTEATRRSVGVSTELLAEWEGHVTKVSADSFEARLSGIYGAGVDGEVEEAVIPIAELSESSKALLGLGALFRLCVSYERSESGQIRRYTEMVFRRLPAYRQQDLDTAKKRAQERVNEFRLD